MPKIVFFISEDWAFLSHRRILATACREAGWQVVLATRVNDERTRRAIEAMGVVVEHIPLRRRLLDPVADAGALWALIRVLRRHRPDILHTVALKPSLYGNLAALFAGTDHVISAIAGIGTLYRGAVGEHDSALYRLVRPVFATVMRAVLRRHGTRVIVQNDGDAADVLAHRWATADRLVTIRGSGVDLAAFPAQPLPQAPPVVFVLVARMLKDKGVPEAVEAARLLRARGMPVLLRLVGDPDPENPMTIDAETLRLYASQPGVEWLGRRDDIAAIWRNAHAAVLPSWHEGLPKALLEALASARPVITTDVPGCRDVIEDEVEGMLVPLRDPAALAAAMERLAADEGLRARMAAAARRRAETRFDQRHVAEAHLALYRAVLAGP